MPIVADATSVLTTVLTAIGSVVTSAVGWMSDYLSTITATGNELLLLFVILPVVGLGVGLIKRLISVN